MERFHVSNPYYNYIRFGLKNAEGRGGDSRMVRDVNVGDIIELYNSPDDKYENKISSFLVRIVNKIKFDSIMEMLERMGYKNMIPDATDITKAKDEYKQKHIRDESKGVYAFVMELA